MFFYDLFGGNMSKIFVEESIGDNYEHWKKDKKIILAYQTGKGKTSFVFNKLLPYAANKKKHIVYICNRVALFNQLAERSNSENMKSFSDYIHIFTYQSFENYNPRIFFREIKDGLGNKINSKDIMYYVFDEAHYFLSDASFNTGTHFWFNVDFKRNNAVQTIFITATPEPLLFFFYYSDNNIVFQDILKEFFITGISKNKRIQNADNIIAEISDGNPPDNNKDVIDYLFSNIKDSHKTDDSIINTVKNYVLKYQKTSKRIIIDYLKMLEFDPFNVFFREIDKSLDLSRSNKIIVYPESYLSTDYEYIIPYCFSDYKIIIERIKNSAQNKEKWLIFLNNTYEARKLCNSLHREGIDAHFLSRKVITKKEKHEIYENLCNNEKVQCKVLITTSVLDCGISIKDKHVKNIVIENYNKTEFIQMLGRVRDTSQKINLFIYEYPLKKLTTYRHFLRNSLITAFNFYMHDKIKFSVEKQDSISIKYGVSDKLTKSLTSKINNSKHFYVDYIGETEVKDQNPIFFSVKMNMLSVFGDLYTLYILEHAFKNRMQKKAEKYYNTEYTKYYNDPDFFIKEQFSWIGKEFHENFRLKNANAKQELINLLENNIGCCIERVEFNNKCMALLFELPRPRALSVNVIRFEKTKASKNVINSALQFHKLNYAIESIVKKDPITSKRKTYWTIKRT